jgi:hypothetical protein
VDDTPSLIDRLVADAAPVKRLRPPMQRAGLWLLAVGALGLIGILLFADLVVFSERIADTALAVEWVATLVTGLLAVVTAFQLSLPDRSPAWALLPIPSLSVWIGSSGYSCYRNWIATGPGGWQLGESANCFVFILAVSLPLSLSILLVLRRALPLAPLRVAAVAALGVAALAACALQFFHPFDVTFLDLGVHLGTIGLVVLIACTIEHFSANPRFRRA